MMSPQELPPFLFNKISAELWSLNSDRAVAVLAGSLIEQLLRDLLKHMAVPDKDFARYLETAGATAMRSIAFAFGIIPPDLRHDLGLIADIRNQFAHVHDALDFNSDKIRGPISGLHATRVVSVQGGQLGRDGKVAHMAKELPYKSQFIIAVACASMMLESLQRSLPPLQQSQVDYLPIKGATLKTDRAPS